jgi:hypothetical protein
MRPIADLPLWIGNARDARSPRELYDLGVAAIVDLAYEEAPAELPRDFIYCRFPLLDGSGNGEQRLRLAIDTVVRLIDSGTPTRIACGAGMSRSPCIAAMALAQQTREAPDVVLQRLTNNQPHDIALTLWKICSGRFPALIAPLPKERRKNVNREGAGCICDC